MRTKTLILTAALSIAAAASSMAQAVYSVNIVGYINKQIPAGFTMVASQLKNSPDNKVTNILPAPPEGTSVYKFAGGDQINSFVDGAWEGDDLNMTMNPGEGVFVQAPSAFTATFVGEVTTGASLQNPFGSGFSIRSSIVPKTGLLQTDLSFSPAEGDSIFQFINGGYVINSFVDGAWEGDTGQPNIGMAEAFWINNGLGNRVWTQSFVP
jgi:hypothetical protein